MSKPNLFDRLSAAWMALTDISKADGPMTAAVGEPGKAPSSADIPSGWSGIGFGPGRPITPAYQSDLAADLREREPRTFQYTPNINANIAPRMAYGLTPFWRLKQLAEGVPEVAMCRRIITEELRNLTPQIVDKETGEVVVKAEVITRQDKQTGQLRKVHTGRNAIQKRDDIAWMTTYPDRHNAWPIWLSRFAYNALVYDSGNYFMRRENKRVTSLRVIDGSTLFCIVDVNGEQPTPPAPAFSQIILGQVRSWMTTEQLWYRPRNLRVDAPYGLTAVEDSMAATLLLEQMWAFETAWYTEGNMPEAFLIPDEKNAAYWTAERLLEYERQLNARMIANAAERRRWKFLPPGVKVDNSKKAEWHDKAYAVALEKVALTWGVHPSEIGRAPGEGLGGKGFQDKGEDAHYRLGQGPVIEYIEAAFNDALAASGLDSFTFELTPAGVEIDGKTREGQAMVRWEKNLITRNRALEMLGEALIEGPEGDAYFNDSASVPFEDAPPPKATDDDPQKALPAPAIAGDDDVTPAENGEPSGGDVSKLEPLNNLGLYYFADFEKLWGIDDFRKHCGVCEEDDDFYGAAVSRALPITSPHLGANRSEIVAVRSPAGEVRPAMFKPFAGEWDVLQDYVGGAQYLREEAAYLIDRALRFYLCPVAWVATIDGENGAVILYARGAERKPAADYMPQWIARAAVFDYIIGQLDRGYHNWLTHPDDSMRPVLIDHGLTFPATAADIRSGFVWALAGEAIPQDVLAALGELAADVVWDDVRGLVGEAATEAARGRLAELLAAGTIPVLSDGPQRAESPSPDTPQLSSIVAFLESLEARAVANAPDGVASRNDLSDAMHNHTDW